MSLVVNIDLGNGKSDEIRLSSNTNIKILANRFCIKHNLPKEAEKILVEEIQMNYNASSNISPNRYEGNEESILSTNVTILEKPFNRELPLQFNYCNPGVKLYEKGIRYLETISRKLDKLKIMQEENENKHLTFSPKINQSKQKLVN